MAGWIFLGNVIVPTFWGVIGKDELKLLVGACVMMEKTQRTSRTSPFTTGYRLILKIKVFIDKIQNFNIPTIF